MPPYGNSGPEQLYEDQTVATAAGTYKTGGIPFTMTKCAAILAGTIDAVVLGSGYTITPVQNSENGQVATFQFWNAGTQLGSGDIGPIGKVVRFSYQPAA
jgi:hypothetical protein